MIRDSIETSQAIDAYVQMEKLTGLLPKPFLGNKSVRALRVPDSNGCIISVRLDNANRIRFLWAVKYYVKGEIQWRFNESTPRNIYQLFTIGKIPAKIKSYFYFDDEREERVIKYEFTKTTEAVDAYIGEAEGSFLLPKPFHGNKSVRALSIADSDGFLLSVRVNENNDIRFFWANKLADTEENRMPSSSSIEIGEWFYTEDTQSSIRKSVMNKKQPEEIRRYFFFLDEEVLELELKDRTSSDRIDNITREIDSSITKYKDLIEKGDLLQGNAIGWNASQGITHSDFLALYYEERLMVKIDGDRALLMILRHPEAKPWKTAIMVTSAFMWTGILAGIILLFIIWPIGLLLILFCCFPMRMGWKKSISNAVVKVSLESPSFWDEARRCCILQFSIKSSS